jgi:KTSC domain
VAWREIYSSSVAAWDYDEPSQTLLIRWSDSGKTSAYEGVPAPLAEDTMKSYSVGTALRNNVMGVYKHRYVEES